MDWTVPLSDLSFSEEEKKAVNDVLDRGWISMGETTKQFETDFSNLIQSKYAIAVSNGTTALHLACLALEIGPGDEVILPSLTFVASANAVKYTGARPVFADILNENDLTISPESIKQCITNKTKAIMVMHYGGYACDMPEIKKIAKQHNLFIIEDASHAPGSSLNNQMLGNWGDIACFSFFANKNMSTAEGGMVTTNDNNFADRVQLLRSHGMTSLSWDRHSGHAWSYDVLTLGYNYRIDEIRSALGVVQLKKLQKNNELRKTFVDHYRNILSHSVPDLLIPFDNHPGLSACHLFVVLLPQFVSRSAFIHHLKENGIQTSLHYPPIHTFTYYNNDPSQTNTLNLPVTKAVAQKEVTLPLYPTMGFEKVELVCETIRMFLKINDFAPTKSN